MHILICRTLLNKSRLVLTDCAENNALPMVEAEIDGFGLAFPVSINSTGL